MPDVTTYRILDPTGTLVGRCVIDEGVAKLTFPAPPAPPFYTQTYPEAEAEARVEAASMTLEPLG